MGDRMKPQFIYMYQSHLDLFWLGNYHTCLEQGNRVMKQYIDRCREHPDESYLIETVVFLRHFLQTYPDYKPIVQEMWRNGQLDIGCAFVDVWQNLVLGETHIRNVVKGKRWIKQELGLEVTQAVHPDLPGLTPQTPQIYAKAGVKTYVTARKIFKDGQIWMYAAPDGESKLMVLIQPIHYLFRPLAEDREITYQLDWGVIDAARTLAGFPLNKVPLSAGLCDLTSMEAFEQQIGQSAKTIIERYREQFPEYDFNFGSFRQVLEEYGELEGQLPVLEGEIPSVWGVACDESVSFFQAARRLEGKLIAAEMLEAFGKINRFASISDVREEWYGTYYEEAHFRDKCPIARGEELAALWEMHIFSQDHNGGGQEAALSEFQKRTMQQRATAYADAIVRHQLHNLAAALPQACDILVFNPLNTPRCEPVCRYVPTEWLEHALSFRDDDGANIPWQKIAETDPDAHSQDQVKIALAVKAEDVGYSVIRRCREQQPVLAPAAVTGDDTHLHIQSESIALRISKQSGAIECLLDKRTGIDWGSGQVGKLYAVKETGNDVMIRTDETTVWNTGDALRVEVTEVGALFVKIVIVKELVKARVEQAITLWLQGLDRLDMDTTIYWHGRHNLQIRQVLPSAVEKGEIAYGTPFYGSNWLHVVEGSQPKGHDELLPEDYPNYREIQMWIHQKKGSSGLAIATDHPGFHWGGHGLEAVLMRTAPSCGDRRFYWENAGKVDYRFRLSFGDARQCGWSARLGQQWLCPIETHIPSGSRGAPSCPSETFIRLKEPNLLLSSVQPDQEGIVIRFFEIEGKSVQATLKVAGVKKLRRISLDGEPAEIVQPASDGEWTLRVKPYEIVTLHGAP